MNKVKNRIKRGFTVVPNDLINDISISPVARFLFVYMASKPDDWDFYQTELMKATGIKDPRTFRRHMSELTEPGWITRTRNRTDGAQFSSYDYTLHEKPECKKCTVEPECKISTMEKMHSAKNAHLTNKDLEQRKNTNKEREGTTPHLRKLDSQKHAEILKNLSEKNKERFAALDGQKRNLFFDWLNYRTEIRDNYRTERGMSTPLRILSENTYEDAKYIFDYSLNNEYTGLFPEQLKKRNRKQHTNAQDNEQRFGAATHAEIEKALAIRRARREAV